MRSILKKRTPELASPQSDKKRYLRMGIIVGVLAILVVGGVAIASVARTVQNARQSNVESAAGKLTLNGMSEGMVLKSGYSLSGTFIPEKDASLYYTVSADDNKVLGFGNIATEKDTRDFSRNISFDSKNNKGKQGELYVYMQDSKGKVIDGAKAKVTFE